MCTKMLLLFLRVLVPPFTHVNISYSEEEATSQRQGKAVYDKNCVQKKGRIFE